MTKQYNHLTREILKNKSLFSEQWLAENKNILERHYLEKLFEFGIKIIQEENRIFDLESNEMTFDVFNKQSIVNFKNSVISPLTNPNDIYKIVSCIENIGFEDILLLMGQKISSTSIRTIEALPPTDDQLIKACFKPYNRFISQIEKQLDKHNGRKDNEFWPNLKGNSKQKEKSIRQLITRFLTHLDWWNIYCHYQHDYVYEIRLKSGHGMRWTKDGEHFIGFLEPYISYESKPIK